MRWWLVTAWSLGALACGVVLWPDAHFAILDEEHGAEEDVVWRLGCSRLVIARERRIEQESLRDPPAKVERESREFTYAEVVAEIRGDTPRGARTREIVVRLSWMGRVLFHVALGAAALGLVAAIWRGLLPSLRHGGLFLAAVLPLAALEWFGLVAGDLYGVVREGAIPSLVVQATPATWMARLAWGGFAVAVAVSWWRLPPRRKEKPVDPGVFE